MTTTVTTSSSENDDAMDIDGGGVDNNNKMDDVEQEKVIVDNDDDDEEEEEEDVSKLLSLLDDAAAIQITTSSTTTTTTPLVVVVDDKIRILRSILSDLDHMGIKAMQLKERAVYELTRTYCIMKRYDEIVHLITTQDDDGCEVLVQMTKAKTAKVVRQILDIVCTTTTTTTTNTTNDENNEDTTTIATPLDVQESIARRIIAWTEIEKRTFLRQRVEAKLAYILFQRYQYNAALTLIDRLLTELKKLDDKQLLVETHLLECKIHFGLRNVPKAKAALTASRTAANAIYVSPTLQADIDNMSGTIHTEEGDYNTAHSYFLEAFEQLDQMSGNNYNNSKNKGTGDAVASSSRGGGGGPFDRQAVMALKYMMLCRILDSLRAALKLSSSGITGVVVAGVQKPTSTGSKADVDLSGMITGKQGVKYAGRDMEAMKAIGYAASNRNLKEFEAVLIQYDKELQEDLLIKHHLHILKEQLLESNLIRIIEPYSCVEIDHIATLIDMPIHIVEKKLSQMILDGKFHGILNQGDGQLIIYEETTKDLAIEKGLQVIQNIDTVVTSLFERSKTVTFTHMM